MDDQNRKNNFFNTLIAVLLVISLGVGLFFMTDGVKAKNREISNSLAKELQVQGETAAVSAVSPVSRSLIKEDEETPGEEQGTAPEALTENAGDTGVALVTLPGSTQEGGGIVVLDVSSIVENVMPCVVAVTDNLEITSVYNPYNFFLQGRGQTQTEEKAASGSGVIIGASETELLILTNNHVIDNEGQSATYTVSSTGFSVQFIDGTVASAVTKGTDSQSDLAVLSVSMADLSAETRNAIRIAIVGNSDKVKVGQGVIAIGNALGYGQSVTTGIISALDRDVTTEDGITRREMQVDAAINPGNSGGGLFDANGKLIGINSAKSTATYSEGMGFAIPITSAEEIIEELMNMETIPAEEQGYLGVSGESVPDSYITSYGYPAGVSLTRVTAGSPAGLAGLQVYDIITAVDDRAVTTMTEMKRCVNNHRAGETVTLTIMRPDGRTFEEMQVCVTLVTYEEIEALASQNSGAEDPASLYEEGEAAPEEEDGEEYDNILDWLINELFGN